MTAPPIRGSEAQWERTLDVFEPFVARGVEGGCLWYGRRETGSVELIGIPRQHNHQRNFEIPAEALADLNLMVPAGLSVLAQLHAHPGRTVRQSPWDDMVIVSRRVTSIVLPFYGCRPIELHDCGIHQVVDGRWVLLDRRSAVQVIELTAVAGPSEILDLR